MSYTITVDGVSYNDIDNIKIRNKIFAISDFVGGGGGDDTPDTPVTPPSSGDEYVPYVPEGDSATFRTASEIVNAITVGWNLGNALDITCEPPKSSAVNWTATEANDYETEWGNAPATYAMFKAYWDKGFNAVRIPVTWSQHIRTDSNDNVTISPYWIARIKEVVNWAYSLGFTVILNSHHDDTTWSGARERRSNDTQLTWIDQQTKPYYLWHCSSDTSSRKETQALMNKWMTKVWTAIANQFKDYGDRLLFEGYNEILDYARKWQAPTAEEYQNMNRLAQSFVSAVRATGGNNAKRSLVVCTFGTYVTTSGCNGFVMPTDTIANRLIVEGHYYTNDVGAQITGNATGLINLNYPRILGEVGASVNSYCGSDEAMGETAQSLSWYFKQEGVKCFWWDDGNITAHQADRCGLMDRSTLLWGRDGVADKFVLGYTQAPQLFAVEYVMSMSELEFKAICWGTPAQTSAYTIPSGKTQTIGECYTFRDGALTPMQDLTCMEGDKINVYTKSGDNGIRVVFHCFYDADGNVLTNKIMASGKGETSATFVAPANARYFRFSIYNPWNIRSESVLRSEVLDLRVSSSNPAAFFIPRISVGGYTPDDGPDTPVTPPPSSDYTPSITGTTYELVSADFDFKGVCWSTTSSTYVPPYGETQTIGRLYYNSSGMLTPSKELTCTAGDQIEVYVHSNDASIRTLIHCFYDENGAVLTNTLICDGTPQPTTTYVAPPNAAFFRFTVKNGWGVRDQDTLRGDLYKVYVTTTNANAQWIDRVEDAGGTVAPPAELKEFTFNNSTDLAFDAICWSTTSTSYIIPSGQTQTIGAMYENRQGMLTPIKDISCQQGDVITITIASNTDGQRVLIHAFYDSTGHVLNPNDIIASGEPPRSVTFTAPPNAAYFRFTFKNFWGNRSEGDLRSDLTSLKLTTTNLNAEQVNRVPLAN